MRTKSRGGRYWVSASVNDADAVVRLNFPDSGRWNQWERTAGIGTLLPLRKFR
jgi:hypothetical protein